MFVKLAAHLIWLLQVDAKARQNENKFERCFIEFIFVYVLNCMQLFK